MKPIFKLPILLTMVYFLVGCENSKPEPVIDTPDTPYQTTPYSLELPDFFPEMILSEENPMTLEGVSLGRMLYYDKIMDKSGTRSCSSCHHQDQSFQIDNGTHQVVPHVNLGWGNHFMWNGGFEGTLEDVMLFEVEVFFETDLAKLNANANYRDLFKKAFDVDSITSKEAAYALAQFARIMTSSNSKFDQFVRGETILSPEEMAGYNLFFTEKGDCFHCHVPQLFTDDTPRNNGLDIQPDLGYFEATGNPNDKGKFKTPTLRNIELTGPYMHDGRYKTLKEVLEFYANDVQNNETVDPLMVYASHGGNKLSNEEQWQLIAFLKTLTDHSFITNNELANPH